MLKTWGAAGLLIVAAVAAAWMAVPASHAPAKSAQTEGVTCGTHQCSANKICCPSCATGEPHCTTGPRCPECAPR